MTRLILTLFCTLFSAWQYLILSLATCPDCNATLQRIIIGAVGAPFAYRLLTPAIIVAFGNTPLVIMVFQIVNFMLFYGLLWTWCKRWYAPPVMVLPVMAMVMSLMFPTYYFSLYTLPEWNFILCALLLLPRWSASVRSIEK